MIKHLLLIDDHEDSLFVLKQLLLKKEIAERVTTCRNGKEGLEYLTQLETNHLATAPELILLDLDMPVMNGWQFLDEYTRRFYPQIPETSICIISSLSYWPQLNKMTIYPAVIRYFEKTNLFEDIKDLLRTHAIRPYLKEAS
ncbi:response regulator [Telluribacter sp. SYSU D00476]|uniref:response regulator n=1 Tax=Telluribacter sp. SYSU D00476 TaxID=2811430 RepID=UPI001FF321C3|nr:response regulator [Telluribacter sp. SYSU D00476]